MPADAGDSYPKEKSMDSRQFVDEAGGFVSTQQVAQYLGVPSSVVRDWAADHGVRRIGPAYVFDSQTLDRIAEELDEEAADEDDEDDGESEDEDDDEDDDDDDDLDAEDDDEEGDGD
jgi:hypothetical protein